jgi:hypothetical protein
MRYRAELATLVLLVLPWLPARSSAQWVEGGVPVTLGNIQVEAAVADGTGGSIIPWSGWQGNEFDIYAQRVTAVGGLDPGWPAGGVSLCSAQGDQLFPAAIPDGVGGAIVVWLDGRGQPPATYGRYGVYAQRVMGDGSLAPGWPVDGVGVCADTCASTQPVLVADGLGGTYVGWSEPGPDGDVRLQHIAADGTIPPDWPAEGILVCGAPNGQQVRQAVPDGEGGVYLCWDDWRANHPDAYLQHVSGTGQVAPGWPLNGVQINSSGTVVPVGSTMCPDGAGGVIAFWREGYGSGFAWSMRSMHIASDGSETPGWSAPGVSVGIYSSEETPDCTAAPGGGAFVTWWFLQSSTLYPIYVEKVAADGTLAPGWPATGIRTSGDGGYNSRPRVAPDVAGGVYVAWEHYGGSTSDVFAQHLTSGGSVTPGWTPGGLSLSLGNRPFSAWPSIVRSGDGAIVAWTSDDGVYAQKIEPTGLQSFTFAVAGSRAEANRVVVAWQASSPWHGTLTIYRREAGGAWIPLRAASPDNSGGVVCDDSDVTPGAHYEYRVGAVLYGVERFYGEVAVEVPLLTLSVQPVAGNPLRKDLAFTFTLPAKGAAELRLFDVRGRLVASMDVGGMGAGRHTATLASGGRPPSGVYLARLSQGGRTASAKVAFLR